MDDVYAVGPPEHVFQAIARFTSALKATTNLDAQERKYECYSPNYDLQRCPHRAETSIPVTGRADAYGNFHRGLLIGGVPVGDHQFVVGYMHDEAESNCYIISATAKTLLDAFLQKTLGYGRKSLCYTHLTLPEQMGNESYSVETVNSHLFVVSHANAVMKHGRWQVVCQNWGRPGTSDLFVHGQVEHV